jgi:SWI/SNF-related matrix-associated actin-dependent regulator of chromatin subfamily A3
VAHAIVCSAAKSLVFSQYSSTLSWLEEELPKHGFQFRTLSGGMTMKNRSKALRDFQSDPPTTIFLLSMRAGAVGINLTQANRMFLMEPCFNPALERQAIGRGSSIRFDNSCMICEAFLS